MCSGRDLCRDRSQEALSTDSVEKVGLPKRPED